MEQHERVSVLVSSLRMLGKLGLDAARERLVSGFVNTYLRLTEQEEAQFQFQEELAKLSPQEREATMELTTTWKEEGIQEGIRQEAFNLTQRFLTKRIGLLPPDQEARMGKLSRVQLEQLFDAAYDLASNDDLRAWLDNNPPEGE
jgi:hypothetical protein